MALFKVVVEAFIASREFDKASLTRLAFWVDVLGEQEIAAITADDIDAALVKLAERGRLKAGKRATVPAGQPLAGSTVNRYLTQAGSVFKHAKRLKLVPRTFVAPTRGIERTHERPDPERYLRPEEVARLIAVARVMDRQWGKMVALITVAYHSGLRVGSILAVRGKDTDLEAGTISVPRTKNGDPIVAALSPAAITELKRLPKVGAEAFVFGNRSGQRYTYAPLWRRITQEARLPGRVFHELRHGHGYELVEQGDSLASAGVVEVSGSAPLIEAADGLEAKGLPGFHAEVIRDMGLENEELKNRETTARQKTKERHIRRTDESTKTRRDNADKFWKWAKPEFDHVHRYHPEFGAKQLADRVKKNLEGYKGTPQYENREKVTTYRGKQYLKKQKKPRR